MIILDANAIVKLAIKEEGSDKAEKVVTETIEGGDILASPDIALAETLNAAWKHYCFVKDIDKKELNEAVEKLLFIWERISKLETPRLAQQAISIAADNSLNAYDSLYVVASKSNNAPLLTFDMGIAHSAKKLGLTLL